MPLLPDISHLAYKTVTLRRGQFLTRAGDRDTHIYRLAGGSLKVFVETEGVAHLIRFGYGQDIVVPLDSFLSRQPTGFYIQALRRSTVQLITKEAFQAFLDALPAGKDLWIAVLEDLVLQQIARERDLLLPTPKARYESVLARSPQLFQQVPACHIAAYLRMTPETLSRLRKS